jgi:hypothetical protein
VQIVGKSPMVIMSCNAYDKVFRVVTKDNLDIKGEDKLPTDTKTPKGTDVLKDGALLSDGSNTKDDGNNVTKVSKDLGRLNEDVTTNPGLH